MRGKITTHRFVIAQKVSLARLFPIVLLGIVWFSCTRKINGCSSFTVIPDNGYVPNKETAVKIAEATWLPVYGNIIYESVPFYAELKDGVWIVKGTLKTGYDVGGTPYIEIQKSDCKILRMYHSK